MPTSSTSKPPPGRKVLPVKWRDSAWSPRVIIRSACRRGAPRSSWPGEAPVVLWVSGEQTQRPQTRTCAARAAQRPAQGSRPMPLPFGHPRFSQPGLDNLL